MKDLHGVQRGRCNSCDCQEYIAPSTSDKLRCEYCNHTPGEHVKHAYAAGDHEETHKEHAAAANRHGHESCEPVVTDSYQAANKHQHSNEPRVVAMNHVKPTQTGFYGNCIYPGCPFPKYVDAEEGKIHNFCSKSCAKNFAEMQAAFHRQGQGGLYHTSTGGLPQLVSQPIRLPGGGQPHPSMGGSPAPGGVKMCKKCGQNPANPGRGWCQQCFVSSRS